MGKIPRVLLPSLMPPRAAPLFVLLSVGCQTSTQPAVLTDQSGAVFDWACEGNKCTLARLGDTPALPKCEAGSIPGYGYAFGDYIKIRAVCSPSLDGPEGPVSGTSRLVICDTDADCPTIEGSNSLHFYECNAGFCKDRADTAQFGLMPDRHIFTEICIGDIPRFEIDPFVVPPEIAAAIAAVCPDSGDPCSAVPEGCRDPRG